MFSRNDCPCLGCTKRTITCHSDCKEYSEWCDKLESMKANYRKTLQYPFRKTIDDYYKHKLKDQKRK